MRGTYMPLIPRPPPRPNLGRPVWRACCPRDHLGLEGKRLQLQPRSPWGVGVACRSLQATLSLELGLFQFKPRMSPHQREGEDTWTGTLICVSTWPAVWTPLRLEQDLVVQYQYHYSTDYAWYLVLRAYLKSFNYNWMTLNISKLTQIDKVSYRSFFSQNNANIG